MKNYKKAEDIIPMIMDLKDLTTDFEENNMPEDLSTTEAANPSKVEKWKMQLKRYMDHEDNLSENIVKLFGVVYGQCTLALKATIKGDDEYENKANNFDTKWLLEKIKIITASIDIKANPMLSLHEQLILFFLTPGRE